ncbi:hypothetical protein AB4097_21125 [Microvirga sp. 2MCAF35]|uniref:hypothetical protein n=1 Tax=Microvirga sp. 2MCAF35 TaxID=3232987 RepID=UPI003F9AA4E1
MALVGAFGVGLPYIINAQSKRWLTEVKNRDLNLPIPIPAARTIGLQGLMGLWSPNGCNDLCQLLLYNGIAQQVVVSMDDRKVDHSTRNVSAQLFIFRIAQDEACTPVEARSGQNVIIDWTFNATAIARATRGRTADSECVVRQAAGDVVLDITIRRVNEMIGTQPGRLELAPGSVNVNALEILVEGSVVARESASETMMLSIPLKLVPYGPTFEASGWEWSRERVGNEILDVIAALKRLTAFNLEKPIGGTPVGLRKRLDVALNDMSRHVYHEVFELVPDYFLIISKNGLMPGDLERLAKLISDERVARFQAFPSDALQVPGAAEMLKGRILDRLLWTARARGAFGEPYKSLESLTRLLPDGSFANPDPRVDALVDGTETGFLSPNLILRLADQGASVANRLIGVLKEGRAAALASGSWWSTKERMIASLRALCRLGSDARAVLPDLQEFEDTGIVPRNVLDSDLWRITMMRLSVNVSKFSIPANERGIIYYNQENMARRAAQGDCET